jgi:CRISPR/Cas system-associated exonuclease Cas4 (RecB family)
MEFRPLPLVEGTVMHSVLAYDLKGRQVGLQPTEAEAVEFLEAAWFSELCSSDATVDFGRTMDEGKVLERMRNLYRFWRANARIEGEIVAVEEELRVELLGIDLPLLGYVDLVVHTDQGDQVIDFKTSASRPQIDEVLDPLDLQKLAMTRGWEAAKRRSVASWRWIHLVKTKDPQVVPVHLPVADEDQGGEIQRLASIVNPTLKAMEAVLAGNLLPVPTQSYSRMCGTCPYRRRCAGLVDAGSGRPQAVSSPHQITASETGPAAKQESLASAVHRETSTPSILPRDREPRVQGCCG